MPKRSIVKIQSNKWSSRAELLAMAVIGTLVASTPVEAATGAQYDFESGLQGWASFNSATVAVSTAAAQAGSQSLLATTNASGAGGPGIVVTSLLLPGATYPITGWARLVSGETATNADLTVMRSDPS